MILHSTLATITDGAETVTLTTQLSWSDTDPLAVTFSFRDADKWQPWQFSVDLLTEALCTALPGMAGVGDVTGWSTDDGYAEYGAPAELVLCLRSPEGVAVVHLPWADVYAFSREIPAEDDTTEHTLGILVDNFLRDLGVESF